MKPTTPEELYKKYKDKVNPLIKEDIDREDLREDLFNKINNLEDNEDYTVKYEELMIQVNNNNIAHERLMNKVDGIIEELDFFNICLCLDYCCSTDRHYMSFYDKLSQLINENI